MRIIISMIFTLTVLIAGAAAQETARVEVVKFDWSMYIPNRERAVTEPLDTELSSRPEQFNRGILGRSDRNDPHREKTIEEKSRELARVEREAARSASAKPENIFLYELKVKNTNDRTIRSFVWEYSPEAETPSLQTNSARRFLCVEKIKAGDSKTLKILSYLPPLGVVDASASKDRSGKDRARDVLITRVEYTDGTVWQRSDRDFVTDSARVTENLKVSDCAVL